MADRSGEQIKQIQQRRRALGLKPKAGHRLARPPTTTAEGRRLGTLYAARLGLLRDLFREALTPTRLASLAAMRTAHLDTRRAVVDAAAPRWMDEIQDIIRTVREAYYQRRTDESLRAETEAALGRVAREQSDYYQTAYRRVLGVDVYGSEGWISEELATASQANVSLIKSIEAEQFQRVEGLVTGAIRNGIRLEELADKLQRQFDIGEGRAKFIARDQLAKWSGQLAQGRQTRVGIKSFIWRTSRDERVVGNPAGRYPEGTRGHQDHFHREGRQFLWELRGGALVEVLPDGTEETTNYTDGLPGYPYLCRCTGSPVIPELEDLEAPTRAAERPPEETAAFDPLSLVRQGLMNVGPMPNPPASARPRELPRQPNQGRRLSRFR